MLSLISLILFSVPGADPPQVEPAHARNPIYIQVLNQGLEFEGRTVTLPLPRLSDGQDATAQRTALQEVAGETRAVEDLLRNSVTAPYLIKVRDLKTASATIRFVDLWFVVYADIARVDPAQQAARTDGKEVEAGNMVFQSRLLKPDDLRAAGIQPVDQASSRNTWYAHIQGRLLDRIGFDVTNHVVASQSGESIVIAARTDPAFDKAKPNANGWESLASTAEAAGKAQGTGKPYSGGHSYTKISRLAFKPEALLVEMHAAFVEPNEWFQGAPILRSKFSVIAQDQIRSLRRELVRKREK
jgi:hypothetical protein